MGGAYSALVLVHHLPVPTSLDDGWDDQAVGRIVFSRIIIIFKARISISISSSAAGVQLDAFGSNFSSKGARRAELSIIAGSITIGTRTAAAAAVTAAGVCRCRCGWMFGVEMGVEVCYLASVLDRKCSRIGGVLGPGQLFWRSLLVELLDVCRKVSSGPCSRQRCFWS